MALRKAFPNDRNYDLWNILLCFLVHIEPSVPEKERSMFGMLAYRMINKAAASIPTDQVSSPRDSEAVILRNIGSNPQPRQDSHNT